MHEKPAGWRFIDENGSFVLKNPHRTSHLYFPLVNEAGMISAVTPTLHGDVKTDHNTFLTPPASIEDLHTSRYARNFWVYVDGRGAWSATGNSALQRAQTFEDAEQVELQAGFLWHSVTRENGQIGLRAEITNFVPPSQDRVELMQVTLTNTGDAPLKVIPTAAIPLYGRSADNLRDHRHVTSLLHRITTHQHGVLVCPTLSFEERGHQKNSTVYGVLGCEDDGTAPSEFFPVVEEFIGEGGSLTWPKAVIKSRSGYPAGSAVAGYEALGGLRFQELALAPGASKSYQLILAIMPEGDSSDRLLATYGSGDNFQSWLSRNREYWQSRLDALVFDTGDARFNRWMKWLTLQPILRRLCGNSFLPYHDYGRGGRGWRDLWQDLLALLVTEPDDVRESLHGNFAGVRMDGSNATIIGSGPGEFKADRNNIPRVWMDHGAWPLLTIGLYIDQSGDLEFLLLEQQYFKDQFAHRTQKTDLAWQPEQGTVLKTASGEIYQGTILEHLLVQHLTAFYHVGDHNTIKLEGADWNDGMDMAPEKGESVAFSALYAGNLDQLSRLVVELGNRGINEVEVADELLLLLDTLGQSVDYQSVAAKQQRLMAYFNACEQTVSGVKACLKTVDLAQDLRIKADWLTNHIRDQEWITNREGYSWFNGYYDNDGNRVEGDHPNGVRMTLTGQTFALMGGVATNEQAQEIIRAADRYLLDQKVGGYRLNTDFGEVLTNLGRCFGYAYGHKENGAMFSHMAVMYAYALYQRGLIREGYRVLQGIYQHSTDFPVSRMYPGIPEYMSDKGRGMYPYLTGSASWYLLTLLNQAYGIQGWLGDLRLAPRLVPEQFCEDAEAGVVTLFAGKRLHVVYHNPDELAEGAYRIAAVQIGERDVTFKRLDDGVIIAREVISALQSGETHRIDTTLGQDL